MKTCIQNIWVRILSCILCSISILMLAIAAFYSVIYNEMGSYSTAYKDGQQQIADNYALYALDMLVNHEDENSLIEFLENHALYCSIERISGTADLIDENSFNGGLPQVTNTENILSEGTSTLLFTNGTEATEWDFQTEVVEGSAYRYGIHSFWQAMEECEYYSIVKEWAEFPITGYVYDINTGLFYYQTDVGYFLMDYVILFEEDGSYCDYKIKTENGETYYHNRYYDIRLDTSRYLEWKYLSTGHYRIDLQNPNNIERVTDSSLILSELRDISYELMSTDRTIGCYYGEVLDKYLIKISWNLDSNADNMFSQWKTILEIFYSVENQIVKVIGFFFLLFLVSTMGLVFSTISEREHLGVLHKVPVGIYSGVIVCIECFFFVLIKEGLLDMMYYNAMHIEVLLSLLVLVVFLMILLGVIYIQNVITRFRSQTFLRYSEFYYVWDIIKWIWNKVVLIPFRFTQKMVRENMPLVWKCLIVMVVISVIDFCVTWRFIYDVDGILIWSIFKKIIEVGIVLSLLLPMKTLQDGAKRIASGDLSEPIDTRRMYWEFKKHGEYINNVSDSIHLAVNEQMKSERFKTELITNVSHDIKTPLTSIINYVDLIKKEHVTDEKLCEYIDVLDRQSARLKKLIEDLMEASKASTGNLAVELEECEVGVLLTQMIGEFEEKLEAAALQVVVDKPELSVMIMADGRHIWRVLDNILNNACKYAMPNTRVYISLKQEGEQAVLVFKNISKAALNIPSEELMERFVRGDSSRNTEGSGLGLSIAQSLTELMGGMMRLDIDGDLFKITLQFQALDGKEDMVINSPLML